MTTKWYSALEELIKSAKQSRATGEQWSKSLGSADVRDEMKYSRLGDKLLKGSDEVFEREELLEHMKKNPLELMEFRRSPEGLFGPFGNEMPLPNHPDYTPQDRENILAGIRAKAEERGNPLHDVLRQYEEVITRMKTRDDPNDPMLRKAKRGMPDRRETLEGLLDHYNDYLNTGDLGPNSFSGMSVSHADNMLAAKYGEYFGATDQHPRGLPNYKEVVLQSPHRTDGGGLSSSVAHHIDVPGSGHNVSFFNRNIVDHGNEAPIHPSLKGKPIEYQFLEGQTDVHQAGARYGYTDEFGLPGPGRELSADNPELIRAMNFRYLSSDEIEDLDVRWEPRTSDRDAPWLVWGKGDETVFGEPQDTPISVLQKYIDEIKEGEARGEPVWGGVYDALLNKTTDPPIAKTIWEGQVKGVPVALHKTFRAALYDAAENNANYMTVPKSYMLKTGGAEEPAVQRTYDVSYPKIMALEAKRLGLDPNEVVIDTGDHWALILPENIRKQILEKGVPKALIPGGLLGLSGRKASEEEGEPSTRTVGGARE